MTRICANGPFFVEGAEGSERNQGCNVLFGGIMAFFAGGGTFVLGFHASGRSASWLKAVGGIGLGVGMSTSAWGAHLAVTGQPLPPEPPSPESEVAKEIVEMSRQELTDLVEGEGWLDAELLNEIYSRTGEGAETFDYLALKTRVKERIQETPALPAKFGRDLSPRVLEEVARVLPLETFREWLAAEIEACAGERVAALGRVLDEERLVEFLNQTDAWREKLNAQVAMKLALKRPAAVTFEQMRDLPEGELLSALRVMAARKSVTTAELNAMVAPWVKLFEDAKAQVKPPVDQKLVDRAKKIREVLMKERPKLHFPEPV